MRSGNAVCALAAIVMVCVATPAGAKCGWPSDATEAGSVFRELRRSADFLGLVVVEEAEVSATNSPAKLRTIAAVKGRDGAMMRMKPLSVTPDGLYLIDSSQSGTFEGARGSYHIVALRETKRGWVQTECFRKWLSWPGVREEVERRLARRGKHR
jgi:hypothetical protein